MMVTCVDGQACFKFNGMVQCYGQMLHTTFMLSYNFLHLVILLQTAPVMPGLH